MRVAIDATPLGSGRGGDETYVRSLLTGLAELVDDGGDHVFPVLLTSEAALPTSLRHRAAFPVQRLPRWPRLLRYSLALPRTLRSAQADLLHSVLHAPLVSPTPLAVQVPDLSFHHHPEYFPWPIQARLNLLVPWHVRQARVVMTVSEYSRRDLIASYRLPPERVFVVPISAPVDRETGRRGDGETGGRGDGGTDGQGTRDRGQGPTVPYPRPPVPDWLGERGITGPFYLYLGNLHPRKNVPRLIEAFARARRASSELADHQLVIAGAHWWRGTAEERAARAMPPGSIVFLGRVSDADRDQLLRGAQALAYPSLFEGFGLPPIEAMAAGTPVIASNTTSFPEILGDAALLVDPLDTDALAAALVRVGTTAQLRADLRERGLRRAALYTPRCMARAALEAFRQAIEIGAV